jgi:hypothetical protein
MPLSRRLSRLVMMALTSGYYTPDDPRRKPKFRISYRNGLRQ